MKKFTLGILFILSFSLLTINSYSQCKNFAKKVCKADLAPYIHDGNYNAAILTEGEDAELYKTFYSGQKYRLVICGSDNLPKIEIKVLDVDRNIVFDNSTKDYVMSWDFEVEATQQLIVFLKVESNSEDEYSLESGCVSIMFGLLDE